MRYECVFNLCNFYSSPDVTLDSLPHKVANDTITDEPLSNFNISFNFDDSECETKSNKQCVLIADAEKDELNTTGASLENIKNRRFHSKYR